MSGKTLRVSLVLWDIDDTLIATTRAATAARDAAVRAMCAAGLPASFDEANAKVDLIGSYWPLKFHYNLCLALVSECRVRGKLREELIDIGSQAYKERFSNSVKPFPDAKPTLTALRREGYKLGIISTGEKNFQLYKLRKTGLLDYFYREKYFGEELVFISSDFGDGADKPSPLMYREAIRRSGARPREIMFVGDRLSDVVGANLVGIRSVLIVRDKASGKDYSARLGLEKPDHLIGKASDVMKMLKVGSRRP